MVVITDYVVLRVSMRSRPVDVTKTEVFEMWDEATTTHLSEDEEAEIRYHESTDLSFFRRGGVVKTAYPDRIDRDVHNGLSCRHCGQEESDFDGCKKCDGWWLFNDG